MRQKTTELKAQPKQKLLKAKTTEFKPCEWEPELQVVVTTCPHCGNVNSEVIAGMDFEETSWKKPEEWKQSCNTCKKGYTIHFLVKLIPA